MKKINRDDTIAAISTPIGEGGIGIVRLSGESSIAIADGIFRSASGKKLSRSATFTTHYGKIADPTSSGSLDEVIVTLMRSPKSYTREDVVEINCHGGIQSVKRVLELVVKSGARVAEPGEFTKRAFLNGRIDLAQAEAVLDVIRSKTERSVKLAMTQLEGGLSERVDSIRLELLDILSEIEAGIDFSEEELELADNKEMLRRIDKTIADINDLVGTYNEGSILKDGVLAVICGKPNVGKSSLMNLLLKRDRVIVSDIPGTTRDAVEEMISLDGIPIRLVDTAGIIDTRDRLEKEGIARSRKYLALSDMVILVLDYSSEIDKADRKIIKICAGKKILVVFNKADLPGKIEIEKVRMLLKGCEPISVSVTKRKNIAALEKALVGAIWSGGANHGEQVILSNARHKELLDKALAGMLSVKKGIESSEAAEIVAIDARDAAEALGLIIGKAISGDILERIFERFCIGK